MTDLLDSFLEETSDLELMASELPACDKRTQLETMLKDIREQIANADGQKEDIDTFRRLNIYISRKIQQVYDIL